MQIKFKAPNEGLFFHWPGAKNSKDKGGITVRALNVKTLAEINKAITTTEEEVQGAKIVSRDVIDKDLREAMIVDYCIIDWTGLTDEEGKDLPCTKANKLKLMREHPVFPDFANEAIAIAGGREALKADAELKNSFRS